MSVFDLLFLVVALGSLGMLIASLVLTLRGRKAKALRTLGTWAGLAVAYLLAGIAVSFFRPQRIISTGDPWCFDDWCLTVQRAVRASGSYDVSLRIYSTARRVSQRANGVWIYLIDGTGRLYSPEAAPSEVPLNMLLQPEQSIVTARRFLVPADAQGLGLITGRGGPYCGAMSFLVVGQAGCLFHRQTMVRLR